MKTVLLCLGLLLTGCSVLEPVKDTTVYHLLEPLVPERPLSANTPAIAVKRPFLPAYLDRQQIVTRPNGLLMISKAEVWAEPLDAAIARVLASNLSRLTGSLNIQPAESYSTLEYAEVLEVRFIKFEADAHHSMVLQGIWKLQPVTGKEVTSHYIRIAIPISSGGKGLEELVKAMNSALEKLAKEILAQREKGFNRPTS
jgi:uncharacterized protein